MQKNILLNLAGIAALSMLCACGPAAKEDASKTEKHAEAEIPETESLAQAEVPPTEEAPMQVAQVASGHDEEVSPTSGTEDNNAVKQVAEVSVPEQEQKA